MADKTLQTPSEATTKQPAPTTFEIKARTNLRADGGAQNGYNLVVLNAEAKAHLDSLAEEFGFRAKNAQGEYFIRVTADARTKQAVRLGAAGRTAIVLTGTVTIQDVVKGGDARGHLTVGDKTAVAAVDLRNGGRVLEPNMDPEAREARRERAMAFNGRRLPSAR